MLVGTVRAIRIYTSLNSPQTAVPKDHVVPPWAQQQSVAGGDGFKPKTPLNAIQKAKAPDSC